VKAPERSTGTVAWISGPVVKATGLAGAEMLEMVLVGQQSMFGEIIRIAGDEVTIQVYEETSGLQPGEPVERMRHALDVELGPGLVGAIFDGIQRPLQHLADVSGAFLGRGENVPALDRDRRWAFTPRVAVGDRVSPGLQLATCPETPSLEHRILVPPDVTGRVVEVAPAGERTIAEVLAVVEDDGGTRHELTAYHRWPVKQGRPIRARLAPSKPLLTGERIIDTFFPLAKGGTAAIPGGFGTGKTMTQHTLAKWCDADLIVYIGCGERGNEMTQVLEDFPSLKDPRTGRSLMERTILIANTSNMPVAARDASVFTGLAIAEYYRDQGYHVAVMADSTSRWAEAMREISSRLEEMPAEGGFPAYLPARLAGFYERAGLVRTAIDDVEGSVTLIGAVSPPGGDFSEPVTQQTKRFTRCFWGLDKELANQRHYPAISWTGSYSDYAETLRPHWETRFTPLWSRWRARALSLLQQEAKLLKIVKLVGEDALPVRSRLVLFTARLLRVAFLQQSAFDPVDCFSEPAKQAGMLEVLVSFHERAEHLLERGAALKDIIGVPTVARLWQMKAEIGNDEASKLKDLLAALRNDMLDLEKRTGTPAEGKK